MPYEAIKFEKIKTGLSIFSSWAREKKNKSILSNKNIKEIPTICITGDATSKEMIIKQWSKEKLIFKTLTPINTDTAVVVPPLTLNQNKALLTSYKSSVEYSDGIRQERSRVEEELVETENSLVEEFKSCPTCHREFNHTYNH